MLEIRPWEEGKRISVPGVYRNVPMDVYHSRDLCIEPSISSSGLKTIFNPGSPKSSPMRYWATSYYNPEHDPEDEEETAALKFGRALHDMLFSDADWKKNYPEPPETLGGEPWSPYRKPCQIWKKQREAEGKTILTATERKNLLGIRDALKKHEYVKRGALDGGIELSIVWKDQETGIWLKARPDVMPLSDLVFVDLKKIRSIGMGTISSNISEYGYYQQGALVAEGCERVLGHKIEAFHHLFVEDKPPFPTVMTRLKDYDLIRGMKANRIALRKFAHGLKTGEWPGPYDKRQMSGDIYAELPERVQKEIDWQVREEEREWNNGQKDSR